jgi:hypothetical protein
MAACSPTSIPEDSVESDPLVYVSDTENYDAVISVECHEVELGLIRGKCFVEITTAGFPDGYTGYLKREAWNDVFQCSVATGLNV